MPRPRWGRSAQGERRSYLMFNFQGLLGFAISLRQMREIAQCHRCAAHMIVLVGAKIELPDELEALALPVPPSLPDIKELAGILRGEAAGWQRERVAASRSTTILHAPPRGSCWGCSHPMRVASCASRSTTTARPVRTTCRR